MRLKIIKDPQLRAPPPNLQPLILPCSILNLTEGVGDKMVGYDGFSSLTAPSLAISVVDIIPGQFNRLTFGVSSDRTGTKPEVKQDPGRDVARSSGLLLSYMC